jgi:hypothetical protein
MFSVAKERHQIRWQNQSHCLAGGLPPCVQGRRVDDDFFIIQFLPIYLADTTRAWLDHLPRNSINCWEDLKEIFTSNFQGTYVQSGNPWNLKGCRQKQGESLRDYIWRFSQKFHELPKICDADVISAFWSGMNCQTLVHELSRDQPKTKKELLGNATRHVSSEEAVEPFSSRTMGKWPPSAIERCHSRQPEMAQRGAPKATRGGQSGDPNELRSLPAAMRMSTRMRSVTSTRSLSPLLSVTSSVRHNSPPVTLTSFSRQLDPIMRTPLGRS